MRVTTRDPMTGNDVADTRGASWVVEGVGENALSIHFESEASRRHYLDILPRTPTPDSWRRYREIERDEVGWDTVLRD